MIILKNNKLSTIIFKNKMYSQRVHFHVNKVVISKMEIGYRVTKMVKSSLYYINKRLMLTNANKFTQPKVKHTAWTLFWNTLGFKMSSVGVATDISPKPDCGFIERLHNVIKTDDYHLGRLFQTWLESLYPKTKFDRKFLTVFDNKVTISNPLDRYDYTSDIDQSTLFTLFVLDMLAKRYPSVTMIALKNPDKKFDPKSLLSRDLLENKGLTGNTVPDVLLNSRVYDIKITKDLVNTKNHIYIIPNSIEASVKIKRHFYELSLLIENKKNLKYYSASKEFKDAIKDMNEKITRTKSPEEIRTLVDDWNLKILSNKFSLNENVSLPVCFILEKPYPTEIVIPKLFDKIDYPEGHITTAKTTAFIERVKMDIINDTNKQFYGMDISEHFGDN